MVSLEQVKLLESRVVRTIEYVQQLSEENAVLRSKLDSYRTRIEELEVLVKDFKQDQSRIEDGILSALDRLSQFEIAVERGISDAESIPKATAIQTKPESVAIPAPVITDERIASVALPTEPATTVEPAATADSEDIFEPEFNLEEVTSPTLPTDEDTEENDAGQKDLGAELDIF